MYVYSPDLQTLNQEILPNWYGKLIEQLQLEARAALRRLEAALKSWKGLDAAAQLPNEFSLIVKTARLLDGKDVKNRQVKELARACQYVESQIPNWPDSEVKAAANHASAALKRAARCPENSPSLQQNAAHVALLILATWGDAREPAQKPGMQYLPWQMRQILRQLSESTVDPDGRLGRALKRLGDLTRYGTSIRAYVDILQTLVGYAIRDETHRRGLDPVETNLKDLKNDLGLLLNHRCESAFNPDREPHKARIKTRELVVIAESILITRRDLVAPLCIQLATSPISAPAGGVQGTPTPKLGAVDRLIQKGSMYFGAIRHWVAARLASLRALALWLLDPFRRMMEPSRSQVILEKLDAALARSLPAYCEPDPVSILYDELSGSYNFEAERNIFVVAALKILSKEELTKPEETFLIETAIRYLNKLTDDGLSAFASLLIAENWARVRHAVLASALGKMQIDNSSELQNQLRDIVGQMTKDADPEKIKSKIISLLEHLQDGAQRRQFLPVVRLFAPRGVLPLIGPVSGQE